MVEQNIVKALQYVQCIKAFDENKIEYKSKDIKALSDLKALAYLKRVIKNNFKELKIVALKDNRFAFVFRHYYDPKFEAFYKAKGGRLAQVYSANLPFDTKAMGLLKRAYKEVEKIWALYQSDIVIEPKKVDETQEQYEKIRSKRCGTQ